MKKNLYFLIAACLTVFNLHAQTQNKQQIDAAVNDLLNKMTLKEKVGQMAQITLDVLGKGKTRYASDEPFQLDSAKVQKALVEYNIGSVLNAPNNRARTPQVWDGIINELQKVATNDTRLKIPLIYGIDAIHGATYTAGSTIFPQSIGLAATFNRELVYKGGQITAYETRASDIPWVFSPQLDLGPDPRSPRFQETFGEDPYLVAQLGLAQLKGLEGNDNNVADPEKVVASAKHFLAYQAATSGKDRTPVNISEEALREYHLPPFKVSVDSGVHSVMINSSLINGMPVHANYNLITKLLKTELGFNGLVVTDWADIENLYVRDHIAKDHKDAIMLAVNAGIDMSMIVYDYERFCNSLVELVKEGKVKQERIDDAVRRILTVKMQAGLFERPNTSYKSYPKFGSKEFTNTSFQAAAESITLLKNKDNILPLSKNIKILVCGPNSNSMRTLDGA